MPPPFVPRRVEDIIFYYYAKLVIAPSSGFKGNYGFIIDTYKRLKSGDIRMSDYERELLHLASMPNMCVFCGLISRDCKTSHVVPRSVGVEPGMHNIVYACSKCCASKGEKDIVRWWRKDLRKSRDELPRVPVGLFLKIVHELHTIKFTLKNPCSELEDLLTALRSKKQGSHYQALVTQGPLPLEASSEERKGER